MRKIEIKDICEVQEIYHTEAKIYFSGYDYNNTMNIFSNKIQEYNLILDKKIDDSVTEKEIIDLLLDNYELQKMNREDMSYQEIYDVNTLMNDDKLERKLMSKIISNGSNIAICSRIGPGNNVIFPAEYKDFNFSREFGMNIFYSEHLYRQIIVFRKTIGEKDYSKFVYIKNDTHYDLNFIGNYKLSYGIINIRSLKRDRIDKLERIMEI